MSFSTAHQLSRLRSVASAHTQAFDCKQDVWPSCGCGLTPSLGHDVLLQNAWRSANRSQQALVRPSCAVHQRLMGSMHSRHCAKSTTNFLLVSRTHPRMLHPMLLFEKPQDRQSSFRSNLGKQIHLIHGVRSGVHNITVIHALHETNLMHARSLLKPPQFETHVPHHPRCRRLLKLRFGSLVWALRGLNMREHHPANICQGMRAI